jgi:hypothetical protein
MESAVRVFFTLALGLRFEMRFIDEPHWWPVPAEDVARGLIPYHRTAEDCLERLLQGEELTSRLSVYRIAKPGPDRP